LSIPIGVAVIVTLLTIFDKLGKYKQWLENKNNTVQTTYQNSAFLISGGVLSLVTILILTVSPILFFNYYEDVPGWLEFLVDIPVQVSDVSCPKK